MTQSKTNMEMLNDIKNMEAKYKYVNKYESVIIAQKHTEWISKNI